MKSLSGKTYGILLRRGQVIYITEDQADKIQHAMEGNLDIVALEKETISLKAVDAVLKLDSFERVEKERRGDWKCEYGHWHQKGEKCGHGILNKK